MQTFTSVPFKSEHGLSQVNGLAKFSPAGIVLEYESKILGLISKGLKDAQLPIADLLDVKFKKGVMKRGARIEIRMNSFARLAELPSQQGKILLKVETGDWELARDAVARLQKDMAEQRASLPPPHPPLESIFEDDTAELRKR
ncbi:MAG TPA: hypothetical protein VGO43_16365 [Pyrinomonadaceae bacterium]|jgi:hypothetical protein|nr:hypothetical protein [Pyrinomonadaceae bacterium]